MLGVWLGNPFISAVGHDNLLLFICTTNYCRKERELRQEQEKIQDGKKEK